MPRQLESRNELVPSARTRFGPEKEPEDNEIENEREEALRRGTSRRLVTDYRSSFEFW